MEQAPTHRSAWALGGGLRTAAALAIASLGCVFALRHPDLLVDAELRAFQAAPRFVRSQLTWFDRSGKKLTVIGNMADYGNVELSPDGTQIAVAILEEPDRPIRDLWMIDAATGHRTVFASSPADENWLIWSRDGRRVIFNSGRNGGLDLYTQAANGVGAAEPLLIDREAKWPVSWSSDGRHVLYVLNGQRTGNDIWVLPMFGDKKPFPYLQTAASENWAAFSPDGKWIAYSSTESGDVEVYVAPFPATGRKQRISKDGGSQARWRRDGHELYFLSTDRELMAVAVETKGADFGASAPQRLFEIRLPNGAYHAFDVTADGQKFLVNALVTPPGTPVIAH
jgi:dipeptidyl aminopeptidase/acylaminoacyl peptidase